MVNQIFRIRAKIVKLVYMKKIIFAVDSSGIGLGFGGMLPLRLRVQIIYKGHQTGELLIELPNV